MNILITAGPTREWLDPIRFLSNPASGRLGYLLAAEGVRLGHTVFLVSGPTNLAVPEGLSFFPVETACQMEKEVLRLFPQSDCLFMTAAVSDWRPLFRRQKIKRKKRFQLTLFPNPDILQQCGRRKTEGQILVGCALETRGLIEAAKQKLQAKNLDYILVDSPAFLGKEKGRHSVYLISRTGQIENLSDWSKESISRFLLKYCLTYSNHFSLPSS